MNTCLPIEYRQNVLSYITTDPRPREVKRNIIARLSAPTFQNASELSTLLPYVLVY